MIQAYVLIEAEAGHIGSVIATLRTLAGAVYRRVRVSP